MSSSAVFVEVRELEPQLVAYVTDHAEGFGSQNVGPVVGPLFDRLATALVRAGIGELGPAIAVYTADEPSDGGGVQVLAAFEVGASVSPTSEFETMTLPGIDQAAVVVHYGSMDEIERSWMALEEWIRSSDFEPSGVCREIYLTPASEPQENWVTELVQPIRPK
jgi:effector-binding domain-containing protein